MLCLIYSLEQLKIGDILQDAFKLTADLPEIETQVCAYYSYVLYSHICMQLTYMYIHITSHVHSDNSQVYVQNM